MKENTKKKLTKWFWGIVLAPLALFLILFFLVWAFADIPSFKELENPESSLATQLIADGGEILCTFHVENRTFVAYDELSPYVVQAAIATEDKRFYKHSGIDMQALARVLFKTLLMQNSSQGGGSTITQQLAKTLYPRSDMRSKIPGGSMVKMVLTKMKEWITAVKLERDYTKDEIVDMYLNAVFYGSSAYGIRTAASTFFDKDPKDLTIEESATLVGIVNKPTRYNPALHPDKALERRNAVLDRMEESGYITKHELDSLQQLPINLTFEVKDHNSGIAPYFRDMIRRYMNADKPNRKDYEYQDDYAADSLRWADDGLYGWLNKNRKQDGSKYNLDRDGLRLYTTINAVMQVAAEEAVREHLKNNLQPAFWNEMKQRKNAPFANDVEESTANLVMNQARRSSDRWRFMKKSGATESEILKSFSEPVQMRVFSLNKKGYADTTMTPDDSIRYYKSFLRAAFVAIEPVTGHVKAYVGGPNYRYFKWDNVSQSKRQVGSTIKPFLYSVAMEQGMTPCTQTVCLPQTFVSGGETWTPRSTDSASSIGQTVTLKWGLTRSSNNISAYLMKQFGPRAMVEMMHRMGIKSYVMAVPAICVGSADLPVFEMVAAYNTFPSKGIYVEPMFVTRIEDSQGNVLEEFSNRKREAISEQVAFQMVSMMQSVVDNGTGSRLRYRYNLKGQIGGKTGTTNDNSDGWFIGYTPSITAGVWVGGEDRQEHFQSMAYGQGAAAALPIWGLFMQKVLANGTTDISEEDRFIFPANMTECPAAQSGESVGGGESSADRKERQEEEEYYFD